MGATSLNKGSAGEGEAPALIADLTGWTVKRRVRQHDGDSDLEGVPGWSVKVKRHAAAGRAEIGRWWAQCVARAGEPHPVLLYRLGRDSWRAVWPLRPHLAAGWRENPMNTAAGMEAAP